MKRLLYIVLFIGIFIGLSPYKAEASDSYALREMTVKDIRKDPWAVHGERVVMTGTFNECLDYTCEICDSLEPVDPYSDDQKGLCFGVSFLEREFERIARFSTITVTGTYEATCSAIPQSSRDDEDITICTDRGSELSNAIITDIHVKRSPLEGYISADEYELLAPISTYEQDSLFADFKAVLSSYSDLEDWQIYFAYIFQTYGEDEEDYVKPKKGEYGYYPLGGVCVCYNYENESCKSPTLEPHTYIESAHQNYTCYPAEKQNNQWVFEPATLRR